MDDIKLGRRGGSGYLYLLTTIFFFSTYEVVNKVIAARIDPFQINFIRFGSHGEP